MIVPRSDPLSVVLADDHTLFREGLAELIGLDRGFTVLGHAETARQAIDLAVELRPDLLLLDVRMPGAGPDTVIDEVVQRAKGTRIVVLTMYDNPMLTTRLLARGAAAYLVKNIGQAELLTVLRNVGRARGHMLLSVSRSSLISLGAPSARQSPLSAREVEVLELLARGYSNARIATLLGIAEATVKRHLTNVYGKLGASSRVDALRLAYESQLLSPVVPMSEVATADIPENSAG
ncbi:response regulator [Peterkaempfera sp. SMS 1(5)a]|uniref:response regulator n=1 Tax=Peterkaempfera podocarpi TaxID=3232308 RepID=UPI00366B8543